MNVFEFEFELEMINGDKYNMKRKGFCLEDALKDIAKDIANRKVLMSNGKLINMAQIVFVREVQDE